MSADRADDPLVERLVTHMLEGDDRPVVVEHVPARVDEATGERYFAPETDERLQEIVRGGREPSRVIETGVFDFAA